MNKKEANRLADNKNLPLHLAVQNGDLELVKLLMPLTKEINTTNNDLQTPLMMATESKNTKVVEYLLDKGANPYIPNSLGDFPLHVAAQNGDLEAVKFLIPYTKNINTKNQDKHYTPLILATQARNNKVVEYLLKSGADPLITFDGGYVAMHMAAKNGDIESLKLLIAASKQGVNISNHEKGNTPLTVAVMAGQKDACELLLKNGADLEISNKDGILPLHRAAMSGHLEIVQLFVSLKPEQIHSKGPLGMTPLAMTASHHLENVPENIKVIEWLLNNGSDANASCIKGWLPLHIAAIAGFRGAIELLLPFTKEGIDVQDESGRTPLSYAAEKGNGTLIKWFLENGADPAIPDEDGKTPLTYAQIKSHGNWFK